METIDFKPGETYQVLPDKRRETVVSVFTDMNEKMVTLRYYTDRRHYKTVKAETFHRRIIV